MNPAFTPFRELFEDDRAEAADHLQAGDGDVSRLLRTRPPLAPEIGSLFDALRAPMLASPDSLTGQLDFIRERWTPHLGEDLRRVLLAIDVLREEDIAIWMRFNPPGPEQYRHGAPGFGGEGFVGDEYVGFEGEWVIGRGWPQGAALCLRLPGPAGRVRGFLARTRPGCRTSC